MVRLLVEELRIRVINNRKIKDAVKKLEMYEDFCEIIELKVKKLPMELSTLYSKIAGLIGVLIHFKYYEEALSITRECFIQKEERTDFKSS